MTALPDTPYRFDEDGLFTSSDVIAMVGITYRMLDYWTRIGLVEAERSAYGSGSKRGWTAEQVARLRTIRDLSEACRGAPTGRSPLIRMVATQPGPPWVYDVGGLRITVEAPGDQGRPANGAGAVPPSSPVRSRGGRGSGPARRTP